MKRAKIFRLGVRDLVRGSLLAALTAILTSVYQMTSAGGFSWGTLGLAVIASVSGYLLMNLMTNSSGNIAVKEETPT